MILTAQIIQIPEYSQWAKTEKSSTIFPIFFMPGVTKLTLTLIFEGITRFLFVLLQKYSSPTNMEE